MSVLFYTSIAPASKVYEGDVTPLSECLACNLAARRREDARLAEDQPGRTPDSLSGCDSAHVTLKGGALVFHLSKRSEAPGVLN